MTSVLLRCSRNATSGAPARSIRLEPVILAEAHQRLVGKREQGGVRRGAVLDPHNRELLAARGFIVYLETAVDIQLARLARDRKRPLLAAPDRRERLEQMAALRNPLYSSIADMTIRSEHEHAAQVAADLYARLQQVWRRSPAPAAA